MDSSPEELKIPILDDLDTSPKIRNGIRSPWEYIGYAAVIAIVVGVFIWLSVLLVIIDEKEIKLYYRQPEIELESLAICPTIKKSVIWDLKFDMTNPYNDSDICIIGGFEVSVFPYNQTKLLTTAVVTPTTCVGPRNHTTVIAFVEASNDYLDPTSSSGTIRLDLKIHSDAYDLVCEDAKVVLSSNNSSLSCGSMVGNPFACSYTRTTATNSWSHFWGLFLMVGFLAFLCSLLLSVSLVLMCSMAPVSHSNSAHSRIDSM